MQEKERLQHSAIIYQTVMKLVEERKAINDNLKSLTKDIETNMLDDSIKLTDEIGKYVRGLFIKIKKQESNRSDINGKIKSLKSDLEDCLFGKGKFDKDQLQFPFDSDDPESFFKEVKKSKVKPKSDKVEDTEDL